MADVRTLPYGVIHGRDARATMQGALPDFRVRTAGRRGRGRGNRRYSLRGAEPVELDGRDRAEVEPVDVHGVQQRPAKLRLVRDGRADQRRADAVEHLLFGAL